MLDCIVVVILGAVIGVGSAVAIVWPSSGPTALLRRAVLRPAARAIHAEPLVDCVLCLSAWTGLFGAILVAAAPQVAQIIAAPCAAMSLVWATLPARARFSTPRQASSRPCPQHDQPLPESHAGRSR